MENKSYHLGQYKSGYFTFILGSGKNVCSLCVWHLNSVDLTCTISYLVHIDTKNYLTACLGQGDIE